MENLNVVRWLDSLNSDTRGMYQRRLSDFFEWRDANPQFVAHLDAIEHFIENLHDEGMMISTIRSILSPLKSFFEYTERINFYKDNSIFMRVLDQWEKKEETKKSLVSIKIHYI